MIHFFCHPGNVRGVVLSFGATTYEHTNENTVMEGEELSKTEKVRKTSMKNKS